MTPGSPSARRLALLGCLLAAAATLALPACGSDGGAAPRSTTPAPASQRARPASAGRPCPSQVNAFVKSLDSLRGQLAAGLSYEQYAAKIKGLRAAYDGIPVGRLSIGCLTSAGTAGESALDKYIDAANDWGECLADASCSTASIEPVLQRKWRLASGLLGEAR
jgi:hypothetical protein